MNYLVPILMVYAVIRMIRGILINRISQTCFSFRRTCLNRETNIESVAPYSLSPVGPNSQKLLRSPRKATRKISRIPF
uniref:Fizzy-related protein n=1 Tax=Triatoma infestans TaxID=30076 RepID=A0A170WIU6_TRIIF